MNSTSEQNEPLLGVFRDGDYLYVGLGLDGYANLPTLLIRTTDGKIQLDNSINLAFKIASRKQARELEFELHDLAENLSFLLNQEAVRAARLPKSDLRAGWLLPSYLRSRGEM